MNKLGKIDLLILIGLFCLAFFICLSSSLNPFGFNKISADASVYLTIARGITEGQVPYRDFFDNKGPLLYLISAPGMLLGGFTGVWIIQLVFMSVSVFFAYKIALFFAGKFSAFFSVVFSFLVFRTFFSEAAGPAEYSMPFVLISLYIFTKYYFTKTEPLIIELLILGFCFATTILLRINLVSLWFVFCLVIAVEKVIKRKFLLLSKYLLFFVLGIFIVFIPTMLYLYVNNAVADFLSQYVSSGSSRAFHGFSIRETVESFFILIARNYSFVPFIVGAFWIIKNFKSQELFFYAGFFLAYVFSVLFHAVIRTNFIHYNMAFVPFIIPSLAFFIQNIFSCFSSLKHRKAALVVFLCVVFSREIIAAVHRTSVMVTNQTRNEILLLGRIIDENTTEDDKIISLGRNRYIYLHTNRRPASRFIYQLSGAQFYPRTIPEFLSDMERRPAIIVANKREFSNLPQWFSPILDMIENEYRLLFESENFFLFIMPDR